MLIITNELVMRMPVQVVGIRAIGRHSSPLRATDQKPHDIGRHPCGMMTAKTTQTLADPFII